MCNSSTHSTATLIRLRSSLGGSLASFSLVVVSNESSAIAADILSRDPYIAYRQQHDSILNSIKSNYFNFSLVTLSKYSNNLVLNRIIKSGWKPFLLTSLRHRYKGVGLLHKVKPKNRVILIRALSSRSPREESKEALGYYTHRGPRKQNEDSLLVGRITLCQDGKKVSVLVGTVCDGAGGLRYGGSASAICVMESFAGFLLSLSQGESIEKSMENGFIRANNVLLKYIKVKGAPAASTIAMVAVKEKNVYFLNAGDTAIHLIPLNEDEDFKLISSLHRTKIEQRTALTSYLGHPKPTIHKGHINLRNESYIIISSDGVHDFVGEDIGSIPLSLNSPSLVARELVKEAMTRGSNDNVTAVVMYIPQNINVGGA